MTSILGLFRLTAPRRRGTGFPALVRTGAALAMIAVVITAVLSLPAMAADKPSVLSGVGTKEDPLIISGYNDLCLLRNNVNAGNPYTGIYFIQTEDIVIPDGVNWEPIGFPGYGDEASVLSFAGNYDGKGHTISNIYCDTTYPGLFAQMDGEVRNVCIESGLFTGSCASSIVNHGGENARVINCCNKADVIGELRAGGITDDFSGGIMFCWNFGNVSGKTSDSVPSGIVGYGSADITDSYYVSDSEDSDIIPSMAFNGTINDSGRIVKDDIPEKLKHIYEEMFRIYSDDEAELLINRWTIKFPVYDENGGLSLSLSFEPEIFAKERLEYKDKFVSAMDRKYSFEGSGTEDSPFLIADYDDLCLLRDCVDYGVTYDGYFFRQTADIRFPDGENWDPIGDDFNGALLYFRGCYDGAGHIIENIHCEDDYASLFLCLGGEVRNLGIESGSFSGENPAAFVCVGNIDARLVNCYNKADVCGSTRASGLANLFNGQMVCCWNFGNVTSDNPQTFTAGTLFEGNVSADIRCSYSVSGKKPFIYHKYSGETDRVRLLDPSGVSAKIDEVYGGYESIFDGEEDCLGLIYIPEYTGDGGFSFTDRTINDVREDSPLRFIPIVFMAFVILILAAAVLITARKAGKSSGCIKTAVPAAAAEKNKKSVKACIPSAVSAVLTISLLCGGVFAVDRTLCNKNTDGITTMQNYYHQEQGQIDVLFVGSSRVGANVDVETLWSSYGISSYNLWGSVQPFWGSYYFLKEAIEVNTPKLVVLELEAARYGGNTDDYRKLTNTAGFRLFSGNKAGAVSAMTDPKERLDYLLGIPEYHMRYHELTEDDFKHYPDSEGLADDKGGCTLYGRGKCEIQDTKDILTYIAMNEKQEYYLRASLDLCREKNIPVILLKTPTDLAVLRQPYVNYAALIAEEYDIPLMNYLTLTDEINLMVTDFYPDGHLNVYGARKISEHLGRYILDNYGDIVRDHRGDSSYDSWETYAHNVCGNVLKKTNSNEDYFKELKRGGQKVTAILYKLPDEPSEAAMSILSELDDTEHDTLRHDPERTEKQTSELTFGSDKLKVAMSYSSCGLTLESEGKTKTLTGTSIILIAYDEFTGEIADAACFSGGNNFTVSHIL